MKQTIFIIDDDSGGGESAEMLFGCMGYATETFCDGVDFLRNCEHSPCGCVLLDYRLPRLDGLEVMRRINQISRDFPVILITADITADIHAEAMSLGAVAVLSKPAHFEHLRAAVESAFGTLQHSANKDASTCRLPGL